MRVGVYVDRFNLYYGARQMCGRSTPGWRWLDLRGLASTLIAARTNWPGATVERLVYCTATIDPTSNLSGHADQQTYLKAIKAGGTVDEDSRQTSGARPLTVSDATGGASWPLRTTRRTSSKSRSPARPLPTTARSDGDPATDGPGLAVEFSAYTTRS